MVTGRAETTGRPRSPDIDAQLIDTALGLLAHHRIEVEDVGSACRVDLATNRQAIAIITDVYESARTGRPVNLM